MLANLRILSEVKCNRKMYRAFLVRIRAWPALAANLEPTDRAYLAACRKEAAAKSGMRRVQALVYALLVGVIAGLFGWINQVYIKEQWRGYTVLPERVPPDPAQSRSRPCAERPSKTEAHLPTCPGTIGIITGPHVKG